MSKPLHEESWLLSRHSAARCLAWLSRQGFLPARWLAWWQIKREVRAWQQRNEDRIAATVLSECWYRGKTVVVHRNEEDQLQFDVVETQEKTDGNDDE